MALINTFQGVFSLVLLCSLTAQAQSLGLGQTKGAGVAFTKAHCDKFRKIYNDSKLSTNKKVQWVLMSMDSPVKGTIIDQSSNPHQRIFGASTSKIFVAGALLDRRGGKLKGGELDLMKAMIISSSNTAWSQLQAALGDGSWTMGQKRNLEFTQRKGYSATRGFSGNIPGANLGAEYKTLDGRELTSAGSLHGNELTARETTDFLYDTYHGNYAGANILYQIMNAYRTGRAKGDKYIPTSIPVGGKTGTYTGETIELGRPVVVSVRNTAMYFKGRDGRTYGLTVLANTGLDETSALLAGGLIRQYAGVGEACVDAAAQQIVD